MIYSTIHCLVHRCFILSILRKKKKIINYTELRSVVRELSACINITVNVIIELTVWNLKLKAGCMGNVQLMQKRATSYLSSGVFEYDRVICTWNLTK